MTVNHRCALRIHAERIFFHLHIFMFPEQDINICICVALWHAVYVTMRRFLFPLCRYYFKWRWLPCVIVCETRSHFNLTGTLFFNRMKIIRSIRYKRIPWERGANQIAWAVMFAICKGKLLHRMCVVWGDAYELPTSTQPISIEWYVSHWENISIA